MKKRLIIAVALTFLLVMVMSVPALASYYWFSGTSFRYIGDIFHEREFEFFGGKGIFQIMGEGMVTGSHDVSAVEEVYSGTTNIEAYFTGYTFTDASPDKFVRILSTIDSQAARTTNNVGVEMGRGEEGYIRQTFDHNQTEDGNYMKLTNRFGNTGGTTKRQMEVGRFVTDRMRVDGYAEVWDTTVVRRGNAKTGWWDIN